MAYNSLVIPHLTLFIPWIDYGIKALKKFAFILVLK
jgi:TM2 domain-containing membrane protein YozV